MIRKMAKVMLVTSICMIGFGIGWMIGEEIAKNQIKSKCENMPVNITMQIPKCVEVLSE